MWKIKKTSRPRFLILKTFDADNPILVLERGPEAVISISSAFLQQSSDGDGILHSIVLHACMVLATSWLP